MTDVRCPTCSAHVGAAARWCGQCYTSLVKEPVKPARPPLRSQAPLQIISADEQPGSVALLGDATPPPPPGTIPPPPSAPPGAPKLKVGRQPWPCVRCETVNKYEDNTCVACGMGFLDALGDAAASLPLLGKVDATSPAGRVKIGIGFCLAFGGLLVAVLTIVGMLVK